MSVIVFPLLFVLFALALFLVLRSSLRRRMTFGELLCRILPAPEAPTIPGTWGQVTELWRIRKNSSLFTDAEDHYKRLIPACTDEEDIEDLTITHRIFLSNHQKLNSALMVALVSFCFGKIEAERCRLRMAEVVRYYANEVLLLEDMSEVMGESCIPVLEGQLIHGT